MIFKEYLQLAHPKRIVGGLGMIGSLGFEFAEDGATGDACTLTNPRELTEDDFTKLYEEAL